MLIGNFMLVVLNLPLIGIWTSILRIPYGWLYPGVIVFSCTGLYIISGDPTVLFTAAFFGLFGLLLVRLDCPPAPFILGFLLGPLLEEHFRRAMLISHGDVSIFLTRPLSAVFLVVAACLLAFLTVPSMRRRKDMLVEEG